MKKISLLLFVLLFSLLSFSQDYIYKSDGEKIAVKIIENDGSVLKYRLFESRDQSVKTIPLRQVYMIDYEGIGIEHVGSQNQNQGQTQTKSQYESSDNLDVIELSNGISVTGKVLNVTTKYIEFTQNQLNQKPQRIPVKELSSVTYGDGRFQTFGKQSARNTSNSADSQNTSSNYDETVINSNNSYFGVGMGYGNSYGGSGIKLQYVFDDVIKIGIHAGAGIYLDELSIDANRSLGYSIGAQLYLLKGLHLNAQYGGFGIYNKATVEPETNLIVYKATPLAGISGLLGFDLPIANNIGLNAGGGVCYDLNAGNSLYFAFDAGLFIYF
jgi:hypothetical protein